MSSQNRVLQVPLPLEVISMILSKLPLQDKLNARLVCNYWRTILDQFENYEFQAEISDNSLVDYLLNSFTDMKYVGLSDITKSISSTYSRNKFPRIRKVSLWNNNSSSVVLNILKYGLVSTEKLKIGWCAFQNVHNSQLVSVLRESKWENLFQLKLTIITDDDKMKLSRKQVTAMRYFLEFASISRLKEFIVYLDHNSNLGDDGLQFQKFCSALYGFICRHSKTLKSLSWQLQTDMPNGFPVPPIPNEIMDTMRSNLKLDTYTLLRSEGQALAWALSSVCGSDSLTSFNANVQNHVFESTVHPTPQFSEDIGQVLQRNRKTLTDIDIRAVTLDMNLLRDCHKLNSLSIGVHSFERGMINIYAEGVKFPNLKSFGFSGSCAKDSNLDSWIVERMRMVEKIQFTMIPTFLTVRALQNLVNGLRRLREITVVIDVIDLGFQGHELNTYCNDTEGLTFKYDDSFNRHTDLFRSYVIEIAR